MKNLLNPSDREAIIQRLANLNPENQRRWGTMTAPQIVPHLTDPLRCAVGDRPIEVMDTMFTKPIFRDLMIWIAPWPKGAPTAPEFLPNQKGTQPEEFERDIHALLLAIHQFCHYAEDKRFLPSPVFGNISNRSWGRLMWRHFDHHLRQFGV